MRSYGIRLLLAVLAVMTAGGCSSHGGHDLSMAQMRTHLDRVPLVAGLTLTSTDEQPRQSPAAGSIVRHFTYVGSANPLCSSLLRGFVTAGYKITDISGSAVSAGTCTADPATASVSTSGGGVTIQEPDSSVRISVDWTANATVQLLIQDDGV
jgi:hypothetical protein